MDGVGVGLRCGGGLLCFRVKGKEMLKKTQRADVALADVKPSLHYEEGDTE